MDAHTWKPIYENPVKRWLRRFVPRAYSFLLCFDLRPGCALIGLMSIILPIVDIVQMSKFLYYPTDESEDADGTVHCPNQWFLKTSPISSYAIFSMWPLAVFHLIFAVVYFLLSLALIVSVTWKLERLLFIVLIGGILVYLPSALVYLLEVTTAFKTSTTKVAAWIFFFSPLIWVYFVSVIYGYFQELEMERLIEEGVHFQPDIFTKWGPQ